MAPGIQKPSWKGLSAHIHLVSADAHTELEIMFSADHIRVSFTEKMLVPPWNGVKPRSPRTSSRQPLVRYQPAAVPPGEQVVLPLGQPRFAPMMPSFADAQVPEPCEMM